MIFSGNETSEEWSNSEDEDGRLLRWNRLGFFTLLRIFHSPSYQIKLHRFALNLRWYPSKLRSVPSSDVQFDWWFMVSFFRRSFYFSIDFFLAFFIYHNRMLLSPSLKSVDGSIWNPSTLFPSATLIFILILRFHKMLSAVFKMGKEGIRIPY